MACFYPVDAWKSKRVNESGKRSIVFRRADGFDDMHLQVPCGKCDGCLADRAREWSIRMYHESSLHERNSFLTLTYEDNNQKTIDKKHLQDFFRRMRDAGYRFRYYACGEYGSTTRRPHYHAVLFGEDFLGGATIDINDDLYTNPRVAELWGHGLVSIGSLTMGACCYVAGYVQKKIGDPDTFSLMSRRPGIGSTWLEHYADDIRRTGTVTIEGKELPIPKRYLVWKEEELEEVKRERAARFKQQTPDEVWDRRILLAGKERVKKAQLQNRLYKI